MEHNGTPYCTEEPGGSRELTNSKFILTGDSRPMKPVSDRRQTMFLRRALNVVLWPPKATHQVYDHPAHLQIHTYKLYW